MAIADEVDLAPALAALRADGWARVGPLVAAADLATLRDRNRGKGDPAWARCR